MQRQQQPLFVLGRTKRNFGTTRTIVAPPPPLEIHKKAESLLQMGKMEWGKHVWMLIHSLTVLVNPNEFPRIRVELLNLLYLICTNLPCPICSDHAKIYLKGINFNAIQTKEQFQNLFHQFHNYVSSGKQLPLFPQEKLVETYKTAILSNMMTNFIIAFRDKTYNPRHISDQHIRGRAMKMFIDWLNKNMSCFV